MDKPEALRLAEALGAQATWVPSGPAGVMHRAAAELLRLHAQRDALLEALIKCRDRFFPADQPERDRDELWEPVNAAIKAVEGDKT